MDLFMVCPIRCLIVVFSGFCLLITLFGKRELVAMLFFGFGLVYCMSSFVCTSSWCIW